MTMKREEKRGSLASRSRWGYEEFVLSAKGDREESRASYIRKKTPL